jgi:hypothetical protein
LEFHWNSVPEPSFCIAPSACHSPKLTAKWKHHIKDCRVFL